MVINERRSKLDGKYIEDIGWYNPRSKEYNINAERVQHWIQNGAQPTDTVHNLLIRAKIITGKKRPVHSTKPTDALSEEEPKVEEQKDENAKTPEVNSEEAPAKETEGGESEK